jgi:hypothetical protein
MFPSIHSKSNHPIFQLRSEIPIIALLIILGIVMLALVLAHFYASNSSPTRVLQVPRRALEISQSPSIRPPLVPDSRLIICGLICWFIVTSHAQLTSRQHPFRIPNMSDRKTPDTFAPPGAPPRDGAAPFDDHRSHESKSVVDPIEGVDLSGIFDKEIHIDNISNIGAYHDPHDPETPHDASDASEEARREALLLKEISAAKEQARKEVETEVEA